MNKVLTFQAAIAHIANHFGWKSQKLDGEQYFIRVDEEGKKWEIDDATVDLETGRMAWVESIPQGWDDVVQIQVRDGDKSFTLTPEFGDFLLSWEMKWFGDKVLQVFREKSTNYFLEIHPDGTFTQTELGPLIQITKNWVAFSGYSKAAYHLLTIPDLEMRKLSPEEVEEMGIQLDEEAQFGEDW